MAGMCVVGGVHGKGGMHDRGHDRWACLAGRGMHGRGHVWQDRQLLQRIVCILLECTLVSILFFSYTIKEPDDGQFGAVDENGTWSGFIGLLIRKV